MRVDGYITRRRCCGKNLAFIDIQVEKVDYPGRVVIDVEETIQVVFYRSPGGTFTKSHEDRPKWNPQGDLDTRKDSMNGETLEDFPIKNAALPYGALVSLLVFDRTIPQSLALSSSPSASPQEALSAHSTPRTGSSHSHSREKKRFEVVSWRILVDPRKDAIKGAKQDDSDGILCSSYLRSRCEAFLRFNQQSSFMVKDNTKVSESPTASMRSITKAGSFCFGENQVKAFRAKIFASFLIETYGRERLTSGHGVLDVAGGKGKLSIELALQGNVPSTIVDPLVRKHGEKLKPKEAKQIRKFGAPHPKFLSQEFNGTTFVEDYGELLQGISTLVGLHPDQPTEDILDVALQVNKPLAIVPCCVFPGFFPFRTLPSGKFVQTYEDFLEYLLLKDSRLKRCDLPFEGKNTVIYLPVGA